MVKKMASRVRAMSAQSVSTVIWLFARRSPPPSFRFSGWLVLDLLVVLGALYGAAAIGSAEGAGVMDLLAPLTVALLLIGSAVIFSVQGLYLSVIRYMGQQAVWDLQGRQLLDIGIGCCHLLYGINDARHRGADLLAFAVCGYRGIAPDLARLASGEYSGRREAGHYLRGR